MINHILKENMKLNFTETNRFLRLFLFEIIKIFSKKKALFFILTINIPHLLYTIAIIYNYPNEVLWSGINDNLRYNLDCGMRLLFIIHIFFFFWVSPFFMTLFVSDVLSGEYSHGFLKTMLLTPFKRWHVLMAKFLTVLFMLFTSYLVGYIYILLWAIFLNLKYAYHLLISFESLKAFYLIIIGNTVIISFLLIIGVITDSPVSMSFSSFFVLFFLTFFDLTTRYESLWQNYGIIKKIAEWNFIRQIISMPTKLVADWRFEKINVDKELILHANYLILYSLVFLILSTWLFNRKEINS